MKKTKFLAIALATAFATIAIPTQSFVNGFDGVQAVVADTVSESSVKNSQINGISLTQKGTTGGGVMLEQYALSTLDLSNATYFAIRYYNPTGAAWPFYFLAQQNNAMVSNIDGTEYYVYDDNFQLKETKQVQYSAIAPGVAGSGYIIVPASMFTDLGTVQALYITLPAAAEAQIGVTELHFEKLGYYTSAQPNFATDMLTLTDFSTWTEEWFTGRITDTNGVLPQIVKKVEAPAPVGEKNSKINGISLTQKGTTGGGIMADASVLSVTDISNATYLAIRYYNPTGAAWPFYFQLQQNGGIAPPTEGAEYYVYNDDFVLQATKQVQYSAIAPGIAGSGYIVIPTSAFASVGVLQALYITLPAAAANQIGVTELHFGKVGYYTLEQPNFATDMNTLADFSTWTEDTLTGRITDANGVLVQLAKVPILAYDFGDVRILEDFVTGYPTDASEYASAMLAKVDPAVGGFEVEKHEKGLKIRVVEPIPEKRDDYAAITFLPKSSVDRWEQWVNDEGTLEGVTYQITNLSQAEVTLCFEIDEYDPDQNVAEDYRGERWSVGIGGRILLYDTVKNEQSLVHSNPMITIPAGFSGWVRIPISCFTKAGWCTWGNSTFDMTRIAQFTIAAYGPINMGNAFVLSNVGLYYNETVVQSIFSDNGNSIVDNLQTQE